MKITELLDKGLVAYHSTTKEGAETIFENGFAPQKTVRLFPDTVSFTRKPNFYNGNTENIKVTLKLTDDDILRLSMKSLWSLASADEEVTPLQLGKRWVEEAKKQGKKAIIMSQVPGIGTEIAVIDLKVIDFPKSRT